MLWIILSAAITLFSGLLSLNIAKNFIRKHVNKKITDRFVEYTSLGILILGTLTSAYLGIEGNIKNNRLNNDLGEAKNKLNELTSDRAIPEEKKSQIIEKLSLRKGNDIKISCVNNPEAVKFAKELMNIFKIAGWKVNPKYEVQFGQRQVSNVAVVIKSEEYMTLGKYIVSTFNNIIQFNDPPILQNSNRNKETIFLVIGTKKASPL